MTVAALPVMPQAIEWRMHRNVIWPTYGEACPAYLAGKPEAL